MFAYICQTCGTQHEPSQNPPSFCAICQDPRQYIGHQGQLWTTLEEMKGNFYNAITQEEDHIFGIRTHPDFGIGQRCLLIQTDEGNVLWDCISYIDEQTVTRIEDLGGISYIAISHPHFYSSCFEWSQKFGSKVFLSNDDQTWITRKPINLELWKDKIHLSPSISLVQLGGHFPGSCVLVWDKGQDHKGILFSSDTIQVGKDRKSLSSMYSYPNYVPLGTKQINQIKNKILKYSFDRIYGAFEGDVIYNDASNILGSSLQNYINQILDH